MKYSPKHMFVWDPWCMATPSGVHLYHLQSARDEVGKAQEQSLGHAFSTDLIHWRTCPPAFEPAPNNPQDDLQSWTGCALWHNNRAYLFYTMRNKRSPDVQAIGLAFSSDGNHFSRYEGNPVIVPDARYFATEQCPIPGMRDCRDLHIVKAPDHAGWYGYFATRRPANDLAHSSVIAVAYSEDLIHWEQMSSPVFAPECHACVEVPNVFQLGDKWYLTCLTGTSYGSLGDFTDSNIFYGTIYAVADSPLGPFFEPKDNVVLGAMTNAAPLAIRHFSYEGKDYLIYTDREKFPANDAGACCHGTLSTPKLLACSGDDLIVLYSDKVELLVKREVPLDYEALRSKSTQRNWGQLWQMPPCAAKIENASITLESAGAFQVLPLGIALENYIIEAEISMREAHSAGFMRNITDNLNGDFVRINPSIPGVEYLGRHNLSIEFRERRIVPFAPSGVCSFKIVARKEHVEIYYNERLIIAFARYRGVGGELGLFVDRGKATFRKLRIRELTQ